MNPNSFIYGILIGYSIVISLMARGNYIKCLALEEEVQELEETLIKVTFELAKARRSLANSLSKFSHAPND